MVFYMKYYTCISTNLSITLLRHHHHAFSICSRSSETGQPQARCMWACRRRSILQAESHILTASVRNGCTLQKSQSWQRAALVKLLFVMLDCMQAKLWRMYTVTVEFFFFFLQKWEHFVESFWFMSLSRRYWNVSFEIIFWAYAEIKSNKKMYGKFAFFSVKPLTLIIWYKKFII